MRSLKNFKSGARNQTIKGSSIKYATLRGWGCPGSDCVRASIARVCEYVCARARACVRACVCVCVCMRREVGGVWWVGGGVGEVSLLKKMCSSRCRN